MTEDRKSTLDPRFDSAFQRHGMSAAPTAVPREPIGLPPTASTPNAWSFPAFQRPEGSTPSDAWLLSEERDDESTGGLDELFDEEIDAVIEPSRRMSFWEIAILVVGIGLVVGGAAAVWSGMGLFFVGFNTGTPQSLQDAQLRQLGITVGPSVIAVGLATLVGLLFLRAVKAGATR